MMEDSIGYVTNRVTSGQQTTYELQASKIGLLAALAFWLGYYFASRKMKKMNIQKSSRHMTKCAAAATQTNIEELISYSMHSNRSESHVEADQRQLVAAPQKSFVPNLRKFSNNSDENVSSDGSRDLSFEIGRLQAFSSKKYLEDEIKPGVNISTCPYCKSTSASSQDIKLENQNSINIVGTPKLQTATSSSSAASSAHGQIIPFFKDNSDTSQVKKRKVFQEIGGKGNKKPGQTEIPTQQLFNSNNNGEVSEESEEELFFQQCRLKETPLLQKSELSIEIFSDENTGILRKTETHKVIVEYVLTQRIQNEVEEIKAGLKQNFNILDTKNLVGFRVQHLKIAQQQTVAMGLEGTTLAKLNGPQISFTNLGSNLIKTCLEPIYDTQLFKDVLDNGRFGKFFRTLEEIGRGGFGVVFKVISVNEEKFYAIKKIAVSFESNQNPTTHKCFREVKSIMSLNHINIVRYHTSWWEQCDSEMMNLVKEFLQSANNSVFSSADQLKPQLALPSPYSEISNSNSEDQSNSIAQSFEEVGSVSCFDWENSEKSSKQSRSHSNPSKKTVSIKSRNSLAVNKNKNSNSQKKQKNFNVEKNNQLLILYIQLEYCSGLTLRNLMDSYPFGMNSADSFHIFSQILEGVKYLHSNGIIHRDLKPSNILMEGRIVKIGDFGLSIKQDLDVFQNQGISSSNTLGSGESSHTYTGKVGTPFYMPPEQASSDGKYNEKIDIYSAGIILFEMIHKMSTTHERIQTMKALKQSKQVPQQLEKSHKFECKIILEMIKEKPEERPSVATILSSQSFASWRKKSMNSIK